MHALQGLSEAWRNLTYKSDNREGERENLFRWLIRNDCDITSTVHGTSLDYQVSISSSWIRPKRSALYSQWMSLLIEGGYDVETTDYNGDTALLSHAAAIGAYNLYAVQWLLGRGSNPNAANSNGLNALMRSMASVGECSETNRNLVFIKLITLLVAGCNPNHCDLDGLTPSYHAIQNSCWYEWCSALEYAGSDICHILSNERARRKNDFNLLDIKSSKGVQAYLKWKTAQSAIFVCFKVCSTISNGY